MINKNCFKHPLILTTCMLSMLWFSPSVRAQVCGDVNGDGSFDLGDLSGIIDYFVISDFPLPNYGVLEFDGHANVNVSDYLEFLQWYETQPPGELSGCIPLGAPLNPVPATGNQVAIEPATYPSDFFGPLTIKLVIKFSGRLKGLALPFHVMIGGSETQILPGSIVSHSLPSLPYLPIKQSGNTVLIRGADPAGAPAGRYEILQFDVMVPFVPGPDPIPMTLELIPFPTPTNPNSGDPVNHPLFIFNSPGMREYILPVVVTSIPCCQALTGNVDCDIANSTDISDLSALIDYLYINFTPLCCKPAANCDGSVDGNVDISDLSAMIDFLYINFTPTAACL